MIIGGQRPGVNSGYNPPLSGGMSQSSSYGNLAESQSMDG